MTFPDEEILVAEAPTGSLQEPPAKDNEVLLLTPNTKTDYRLTIEPSLMLLLLGKFITIMAHTNLFEERMCLHTALGQNKSVNCYNMTAEEQAIVQPAVAKLMMIRIVIDTFFPCTTALFLGPWSDKNGRLPLMLSATSGAVICNCMYCVFSTMPELPPITLLLCTIPIALSGGNESLYIASFCYIVDISDSKRRAFRLGVLQTCISLGTVIGSILSPILFNKSATLEFAVSSIISIIALLYLSFFVKETVTKKEENTKLFDIGLIKDMWQTVVRQRYGYLRSIIMLSAVALTLNLLSILGEEPLMYMYLQKQFYWTLNNFSVFDAYTTLLSASIPMIGLYIFSSKLQIPDMYLVIAATGLRIIEKIGTAFATQKWQFYLVKMFGCASLTSEPLVQSQLSKIFPSNDFGKIYAFISAIESIGTLLGSPIYTAVYNMTIIDYANCIFLLSSIIGTFILALYVIILFLLSKSTRTEELLTEN